MKTLPHTPFKIKPYPTPYAYREQVRKALVDLEKNGIIERSTSPEKLYYDGTRASSYCLRRHRSSEYIFWETALLMTDHFWDDAITLFRQKLFLLGSSSWKTPTSSFHLTFLLGDNVWLETLALMTLLPSQFAWKKNHCKVLIYDYAEQVEMLLSKHQKQFQTTSPTRL